MNQQNEPYRKHLELKEGVPSLSSLRTPVSSSSSLIRLSIDLHKSLHDLFAPNQAVSSYISLSANKLLRLSRSKNAVLI